VPGDPQELHRFVDPRWCILVSLVHQPEVCGLGLGHEVTALGVCHSSAEAEAVSLAMDDDTSLNENATQRRAMASIEVVSGFWM
jgi:hypothetical protein